MNEETKKPVMFCITQDEENNLELNISGTGKELAAMLASVMDDDPDIVKLIEFAFMMLEIKHYEDTKNEDEKLVDLFTDNPPIAEA
jgi:hypothetical protein